MRVRAIIAMIVVSGCIGGSSLDPTPEAIDPSVVDGTPIPVTIRGRHFNLGVKIDYGDKANSVVRSGFVAEIGGVALTDVTYRDSQSITAQFPGGLDNGLYALHLVDPNGNEATLADAFRITDDPDAFLDAGNGPDANLDAGNGPDANQALGKFDAPTQVESTFSVSNFTYADHPTVTADLLELYFESNITGTAGLADIWTATRATPTDPWGVPTRPAELNSEYSDGTPEISPDGLTLWLSSSRGGFLVRDVWVSTRPSRQAPWTDPVKDDSLTSTGFDLSPTPSSTLLRMTLTRAPALMPFSTGIYQTTRAAANATWDAPVLLAELDNPGWEAGAFLREQDLLVYFESDVAGPRDLYSATRSAVDSAFGTAEVLSELNSEFDDANPWVSEDLRYIIFSSSRSGSFELYEARR